MRGMRGRVLVLHLGLIVALFAAQFVLAEYHHTNMARIMVLAAYATGYNLLFGYTGLMSLGHAMFFAAGMYGAGLSIYYLGFGALSGFALGVLAAIVLAALFGLFALRTSGVSFLIVTMMFGQACYLVILYFNEITLGDQGFILSGRLPEALVDPDVKYNVALAVFAACFLVSLGIVRSPLGRILVAIRVNEERTRLLGYNTYACKLLALVISGAMAGRRRRGLCAAVLLRGRVLRRDPALDLPAAVGADGRRRHHRRAVARHRAHVLSGGRDQRLDQRLPVRGGRGAARAGALLPARHHGNGACEARPVAAVSAHHGSSPMRTFSGSEPPRGRRRRP